jgi:acetyltransferase-like isoleucine patch superfamily enzyme
MLRSLCRTLWALMPASNVKNRLAAAVGYAVDPSASVGPVLILKVQHLDVGASARIGPFSVIRDMKAVSLGAEGRLGQWNWVSSAPQFWPQRGAGMLTIAEGASVTSRHYLDCSGGVTIGTYATVAGVRSTFVTHGIDVATGVQQCSGVRVGEYSIVGSNTKLVPGGTVPSHCVVGMGSVVTVGLVEEFVLYAGAPARRRKALDPKSAYFTRTHSRVSVDGGPAAE